MLEHGGRVIAAARTYGILRADWLDLSTGINPQGWPVPNVPARCWERLPEEEDGLVEAACRYYGAPDALPVAGSQAAIRALPGMRARSRVGVPHPVYAEHADAWRRAGHEVVRWSVEDAVDGLDVLLLVHPGNPSGARYSIEQLLDWHAQLARRGGWLIVDEAFMDATPDASLAAYCSREGLVVLRSLGKFFGAAGARVGFVLAESGLLEDLRECLGPWTVAGPSRWVAQQALADTHWQGRTRARLHAAGERLRRLLIAHALPPDGGSPLFQWVKSSCAARLHDALARRAILTRLIDEPPSLRFGLPGTEAGWARLEAALRDLQMS